jgi:biotin synthase
VSRHDDNGRNPRPDNRSGWLEGETPDVVSQTLSGTPHSDLDVRLWDPSTQLRYTRKRARAGTP